MARIFITGSADGLGSLSAKALIEQGHEVVLHARNAERGQEAIKKVPGAESVVTGDLSNIEETKSGKNVPYQEDVIKKNQLAKVLTENTFSSPVTSYLQKCMDKVEADIKREIETDKEESNW